MTAELLLSAMAGLGLLFYGLEMVTGNLSAMAGESMRRGITAVSKNAGLAMLFGTFLGVVLQSARSAVSVMASFVQADIIDVRRAMRVALWSNFGSNIMIFSVIFPINLFVLFMMAAGGAALSFRRPKSFQNAAAAGFGLARMLFGLKMVSDTAVSLTGEPSFTYVLTLVKESMAFAFLFGLVLAILAQSYMMVMLLSVSMASHGIFGLDQAIMIIFGANTASSLITGVTSMQFDGEARQVQMGHILYNFTGLLLFLPIYLAGRAFPGGHSGMTLLLSGSALSVGGKAAVCTVAFNCITPTVLTMGLQSFYRLCARLMPTSVDAAHYRPKFLGGTHTGSAVATLMLVDKEQVHLLKRMPAYCAALRVEPAADDQLTPEVCHTSFGLIGQAIARAQSGVLSQQMNSDATEWLVNQQKRQDLLASLDEACFDLWQTTRDVPDVVRQLRDNIVEAVETLILYAIDAADQNDLVALDLLDKMTANHGPAMERIRRKYLELSEDLPLLERNHVLQITSIYEHLAWTFHRFGALLRVALEHQFKLGNQSRAQSHELPAQ